MFVLCVCLKSNQNNVSCLRVRHYFMQRETLFLLFCSETVPHEYASLRVAFHGHSARCPID